MLAGSGAWFSQSDARLEYRFASGSFIALRERIWQNPRMQGLRDAHAIYLEYRTPLRLPIGPSRRTGRATGRVVDAETGRPVAGAVVRMGDQAALSDKRGRVAFSGLNPERYVVSLDPSGTGAGALVTGDAVVDMREPSSRPAVFAVAVARGAHLRVLVRRMALAGGSLGGQADSLVSAGALPNVLLALEGARDTLLQATDDHGRLDFGSVPPGSWVVSVRPCDLPDHHVFETDRVVVTLAPGENREVELRVVPQRRAVTFIGDEREIKAKPMPGASPPTAPPPTPSPAAPPKAKRRTRDRR
jgi:protocatechuate 3,4-dioxygenase beta subunit